LQVRAILSRIHYHLDVRFRIPCYIISIPQCKNGAHIVPLTVQSKNSVTAYVFGPFFCPISSSSISSSIPSCLAFDSSVHLPIHHSHPILFHPISSLPTLSAVLNIAHLVCSLFISPPGLTCFLPAPVCTFTLPASLFLIFELTRLDPCASCHSRGSSHITTPEPYTCMSAHH